MPMSYEEKLLIIAIIIFRDIIARIILGLFVV
jgi:hypothetical protein